jgi:hypothetical protein
MRANFSISVGLKVSRLGPLAAKDLTYKDEHALDFTFCMIALQVNKFWMNNMVFYPLLRKHAKKIQTKGHTCYLSKLSFLIYCWGRQ